MKNKRRILLKLMIVFCTLLGVTKNELFQIESAGGDRSIDFKTDTITINVNGVEVYNDGSAGSVNFSHWNNPKINVSLGWSQVNPSDTSFLSGEFVLFKVCDLVSNSNLSLANETSSQRLYDDNGIHLGEGSIIIEQTSTNTSTVYYKVVFNGNIEGMNQITGSMKGSAEISNITIGDTVGIVKEGSVVAEFEKQQLPSVGGEPAGVMPELPIPETAKRVNSTNENTNTIKWDIDITEFAKKQFYDYKNNINTQYNDLIFEEILDGHQTFNINSYNLLGVNMVVSSQIYLYDSENVENSTAHKYLPSTPSFNLGDPIKNGDMTMVDPSTPNAENYVRNTPRTFTVVYEADPVNPSLTRERLIVNFGAPGSTGLRYVDMIGETNYLNLLAGLQASYDNASKVLSDNSTAPPTQLITDDYGRTATVNQWSKMKQLYGDSLTYYTVYDLSGKVVGPYVYSMNLTVTSKVKIDQNETGTIPSVENGFKLSGGFTPVEDSVSLKNFWSAIISATPIKGDAVIYKTDSLYSNGQSIDENTNVIGTIKDVEFEVYKENGTGPLTFKDAGGKYVYDAGGNVTKVKTDESGSLILTNLAEGNYYLKEVSTNSGYYDNQNQKVTFTINFNLIEYTLVENEARGISLVKVDEDDNTGLSDTTFKLFKYTQANYSDAVEVTGFSTISIDGKRYYTYDGSGSSALTTLNDGTLTLTQLDAGKYYLVEDQAKTGYVLSADKHLFELTEEKENEAILQLENITNTKIKGDVELTKTDKASTEALEGVEFSLYKKGGLLPIQIGLKTNSAGKITVNDLVPGDYYFVETKALVDYQLDKSPVEFTIPIGSNSIVKVNKTNTLTPGDVVLTKVDGLDNHALSGAEFGLYDKNNNYIDSYVSDKDGLIKVENLAVGKYYFIETKAPNGYDLDTTPVKFTISKGQTSAVQVSKTNTLTTGNVALMKVDKANNRALENAEFNLYDASDKLISGPHKTDVNGQVVVKNLMPGNYYFLETKAPNGYSVDSNKQSFIIQKAQTNDAKVIVSNEIINGAVTLVKEDDADKRFLIGAEFKLYNENNNYISTYTTNALGIISVNNLTPGNYYFVESKAPAGYQIDTTPVLFEIKKEPKESITVYKTNKKEKRIPVITVETEVIRRNASIGIGPNTGDYSTFGIYGLLCILALIGTVSITFKKKNIK